MKCLILVLQLLNTNPNDTLYMANLPVVEVSFKAPAYGPAVLLAKLLNGECPHEPVKGQEAVASVVCNRLTYKKKTVSQIADIIFQPGQFDGVKTKRFKTYTREQYIVAYRILTKYERTGYTTLPASVVFFHNKKTSTDKKWVKSLTKYEHELIGNHVFCHSKHLLKKIKV